MASVRDNPAFEHLLEATAGLFIQAGLYFSRTPAITFVCGGVDESTPQSILDLAGYPGWVKRLAEAVRQNVPNDVSLRKQFIDWAEANKKDLACVRAETAITDLMGTGRPRGKDDDLAQVETVIAEICDAVIVFSESPGSLAELGIFCMRDNIARKTMVVLREHHQGGSFVNRGPVARIAKISNFPPIGIGSNNAVVFDGIVQKITVDPPHNDSVGTGIWHDLSWRQKFCFVDTLVDVVGIISNEDLQNLINRTIGKYDYWELRLLVGMMLAMGRAKRTPSGMICRVVKVAPERFIVGQDKLFTDMKARWSFKYRESSKLHYSEYVAVN